MHSFRNNGHGTQYFISDSSREVLIAAGTMCNDDWAVSSCGVYLPDGSYYFRLAGGMDRDEYNDDDYRPPWLAGRNDYDDDYYSNFVVPSPLSNRDITYRFCGVNGFVGDELSFQISSGTCIPTLKQSVETMSMYSLESRVSMVGTLYLEGLTSEFQASDNFLLEQSVMDVLSAESMMHITSVPYTDPALQLTRDQLVSSYVKRLLAEKSATSLSAWVNFDLDVVAEDFGVDGSSYSNIQDLVAQIADEINAHIDNTQLKVHITSNYHKFQHQDGSALLKLQKEELLNFEFSAVTYAQVLPGSTQKGRESNIANDVFFGSLIGASIGSALLLASVLFYFLVYKKRNKVIFREPTIL